MQGNQNNTCAGIAESKCHPRKVNSYMGLNWNFFRITPEHYNRLLSNQAVETAEEIDNERFAEGLESIHSPHEGGEERLSFDHVYHLSIRTDYDELDTLMTLEGDDGPILMWPLGESGIKLSFLGEVVYLLNPEEVRSTAPALQLLLNKYLDQRYQAELKQIAEEVAEEEDIAALEELYPEMRECFSDLTHFVQTAAEHGEAILWDLS